MPGGVVAVRRYRDFRNDFSAGVVAEDFLQRGGDEVTKQALVSGDNVFVTAGGSVMRRPGTERKFLATEGGRLFTFEGADSALLHAAFSAGVVRLYRDDGAILATLSDAPWGAGDLFTMTIVNGDDALYVASTSFYPQEIVFDDGAWTLRTFSFASDDVGRKLSPFWRFDLPSVTMRPSAYSGSVTVDFSAPVLTQDHVGVHFMYMGSQLRITAVSSPQSASAAVIDELYPTVRVGVGSAVSYKIGEIVEGDITNTRGQVVSRTAGFVDVVLTEGYTPFQAAENDLPGERLIGAEGSSEISTVQTLAAPLASNIWFEELISPARGYPQTAAMHRARLVFAGFPGAGNLIAASARASYGDFDPGAASDRDAILEFIGEDPNAEIRHLISTEQLVILTDRGAWYVPEGGERQFTPRGISFDPISPDPASSVSPAFTPEGVVFVDREGRVLLLSLTGTQRGAFQVTDLTTLGYETIRAPKQLIYSSGIGGRKERAMIVLNGDGTAAAFTYRRGAAQAGWLNWSRAAGDAFLAFSSFNGEVYCLADVGAVAALEQFDFDAVLDGEIAAVSTAYPNESFHILLAQTVIGEGATDGAGALGGYGDETAIDKMGRDFAVKIEPAPLVIPQAGRQVRMLARTYVDTINTGQFRLNGSLCQAYGYSADVETPPPVVDKVWNRPARGSSERRTCVIEQPEGEGAPLHVRSITMEVAGR